jgi:cell division transport system ATP-binding protein
VLKDVTFKVSGGEMVYLVGKVGSGKSSLLKTMYADVPIKNGTAYVLEYDMNRIKRREVPYLRRRLGIVFQDFQLLTDRSVYSNLEFVLKSTGMTSASERDERIEHVLQEVGLTNKSYKMPHELSGGEQQRVVIARALLNNPDLILADEPTGNLDPETGEQIFNLLNSIAKNGTSVLLATHNHSLIDRFPGRVLLCEDKRLSELP